MVRSNHHAHGADRLIRRHMRRKQHAEFVKRLVERLATIERMTDRFGDPAALAFDHVGEQVFLVLEIDVDRAFGNAGGARDVVHAGGFEALLHEHALGPVEDLLALGRILACHAATRLRGGQSVFRGVHRPFQLKRSG